MNWLTPAQWLLDRIRRFPERPVGETCPERPVGETYLSIETTKLVGVDPHDYLRDATHAALKGEPIPLPGERAHAKAA